MAETPIVAIHVSSDSFAVAGDRSAEFVAGVRIQADCGADGVRYGTVVSAVYSSVTGVTTVILTPDAAGLTAGLTGVLHGNDVPASLCHHGHTGPADGGVLDLAAIGASRPQWLVPAGTRVRVGEYQQYAVRFGRLRIEGALAMGAGAQLIVDVHEPRMLYSGTTDPVAGDYPVGAVYVKYAPEQ